MAERLERRFGARIEWRPYDLHPEYPPEGIPRSVLIEKYGPEHQDRLRVRFAEDGFVYNPPPEWVPNTRTALRLTELARTQGKHEETHDRLMKAYWEDALDIGDRATLQNLANELGLEDVAGVLDGNLHTDEVARQTSRAHALGINGIPAFVLDGRALVMGAHPDEVFERAFASLEATPPAP